MKCGFYLCHRFLSEIISYAVWLHDRLTKVDPRVKTVFRLI